jgi:hypothetical protein
MGSDVGDDRRGVMTVMPAQGPLLAVEPKKPFEISAAS